MKLSAPDFGSTRTAASPRRRLRPALISFLLTLACAPLVSAAQERVAPSAERAVEIARYEAAIAELDGSYTPGSVELYRGLAEAQARQGETSAAADNYREALQALRINEGLASQPQLAILDPFNEVLFQLQDWEALDTNYHLARDLTERLHGADDSRALAAASRLASWKIRAFQTQAWRPKGDRSVQEAAEIYRSLLRRIPVDDSTASSRATLLAAKGLAHFYSAQHVANIPVNEFQRLAPQTTSFQTCVPLLMSIDGAAPSGNACQANQIRDPEYYAAQQREKNNAVRRHLSDMRQSFQEAIDAVESDPSAGLRERAEAMLNLGDANLLAQDYTRARAQYSRVWHLLTEANELTLREALLDRPVKALSRILDDLPFDRRLHPDAPLGTVSFDVNERGEIVNIDIQGPPAALGRDNLGAIAIRLDQSTYRPRIVDGRPTPARVTLDAAAL